MTHRITGTKPEHDLHTCIEEKAKLHLQRPWLTRRLTRSLIPKTNGAKQEHDPHKQYKKVFRTHFRRAGFTFILTGSSDRFLPFVKMLSSYHSNSLQNSFASIFTVFFTYSPIAFIASTHLSVLTATVYELYSYSITFKAVAL